MRSRKYSSETASSQATTPQHSHVSAKHSPPTKTTYTNQVDIIRKKYVDFTKLLGPDDESDGDESNRLIVAGRIDSLLVNWATDFARETELRAELQSAISRVDSARSERSSRVRDDLTDSTAQQIEQPRGRRSMDQLLTEKLESIEQLETRIESQHLEILNCELNSAKATQGER